MVESFLFCFFVWTIWIVDDILFWALRPHPVQDKIEEELLFCFFFFFLNFLKQMNAPVCGRRNRKRKKKRLDLNADSDYIER